MNSYDVLVIGAGPAGSTAAKAASEQGLRVLLIEKKANVGLPVRCAGYIPRLLSKETDFDANAIVQKIDFMRTYLPDDETIERRSPGFILERSLFDKDLALRAINAGADLMSTVQRRLKSAHPAATTEPLFLPRISLIVITSPLPKTWLIFSSKLKCPQPLAPFPEVSG